jgi:hypothetical protein
MSNRVEQDTQIAVVVHSTTLDDPTNNVISEIVPRSQLPVAGSTSVVTISEEPTGKVYTETDFVQGPVVKRGPIVVVENLDSFDNFKRYIKGKFCYDSTPLDQAVVVGKKNRKAFRVDMWTLMEHRSVEWKTRPYRNESVPSKGVDNVFDWTNFSFDTPPTIISKDRIRSHVLTDTQRKTMCSLCNGQGKQHCTSCNGVGNIASGPRSTRCSRCHGAGKLNCAQCAASGHLLSWAVMAIKWHTIHSVGVYQNTFLPEEIIRRIPNKSIFYENDMKWTNDVFLLHYGNLYKTITENSPVDFGLGIQQQYQDYHLAKLENSMIIRQLKCLIREVDIIETDYKLDGYVNTSEQNKGE